MMGTPRRPSAEELEELVELIRRDPGSPVFVDLGEAYLALGRPRDAVDVGARGLRVNPHNLEGRMMVSRAFVMLHQWKQAQAELLKIVKSDRTHKDGFLLLGEVLMRRGDYERALPVLQHAQNLDPANPTLLDLLRRVRSNQPLEPPVPIPTPQSTDEPLGYEAEPGYPVSAPPSAPTIAAPAFVDEQDPTTVASPMAGGYQVNQPDMLDGVEQPGELLHDPEAMHAPPAQADPFEAPIPEGYPDMPAPTVRPRVLPAEKPKDAAQSSLRQSAAVGENYLNNLLTAGLLDMPNVNAPEAPFELKPGKRWGRSARRAFLFLFVMMFFGLGGGGTWYYIAQEQRTRDVAALLQAARGLAEAGTFDQLKESIEKVQAALKRDPGNTRAMAAFASTSGLMALLYGTPADEVDLMLTSARRDIAQGDEGWRDIVVADVAATLAVLPDLEQPKARLGDARKTIEAWLDKNPDDRWARWLRGVAMQRAGDRDGALAEFRRAEANGQGPVIATISVADMLLDAGDIEQARERYQAALGRIDEHPLAIVGQAILSTEASTVDQDDTLGTLNIMKENQGPRVDAYRRLARALATYVLEDYVQFSENLDKARGVKEPRFLARVALARISLGKISEAASARKQIVWYGEKAPQADPLVAQIDAEFLLARGLPESALQKLKKVSGIRAQRLRGRALYDLGRFREAIEELEAAARAAPDDLEVRVWREAARLAGDRRARRAAGVALDKLSRTSNNKMVRYAHGDALLRLKNSREARRKFDLSVEELNAEQPNPLMYRSYTALAQLEFDSNLRAAARNLARALEQVPGYLPALAVKARIQLRRQDYKAAAQTFQGLIEEPEAATAQVELGYAESVVSTRGKLSEEARNAAREAVRRASQKGAAADELARVAQLVDPALLQELQLQPPKP